MEISTLQLAPNKIFIHNQYVSRDKEIASRVHYQLVRKVAGGGMGIVYEAIQEGAGDFEKTVAIKLIREEFSSIKEFRKNFIGEARLVADLIHTNIVQTYHLGLIGDQYFMTMEYVNGINLEEFIDRHHETGQLIPVDLAAFIISRVCRGLAYAHQKCDRSGRPLDIVHRDINPRNIMVGIEGDVKLTDFGIAKAIDLMYNKEGEIIAGKDEYLSPEQARREITDARADIFPCGIVLAEMLLGHNPFEADSGPETRQNILKMPIPNFPKMRPDIDKKLAAILKKCLTRPREKRYQSATDLLTALEVYLYSDGYGPTNEKLATYMKELFSEEGPKASERWEERKTQGFVPAQ